VNQPGAAAGHHRPQPPAKQEMQAWLPRFGFLLDDLTPADEDQLLARDLTPAALVTLRLL